MVWRRKEGTNVQKLDSESESDARPEGEEKRKEEIEGCASCVPREKEKRNEKEKKKEKKKTNGKKCMRSKE